MLNFINTGAGLYKCTAGLDAKVLEIEVFENQSKSDSAQNHTAQSLTLRSVGQFWIFGHFNFLTLGSVILQGVGLGAV